MIEHTIPKGMTDHNLHRVKELLSYPVGKPVVGDMMIYNEILYEVVKVLDNVVKLSTYQSVVYCNIHDPNLKKV